MKYSSLLTASLLVLMLTACQPATVKDNPGFVKSATLDDTHPDARLVLGSKSLVGEVRMSNVKLRKVGTLTQAQVAIQNLSNKRYHLEYRVEWEDVDGFIVDQSGVWRQIILAPTQIETFMATGKKATAAKIIVNLRNPDDPFSFEGEKDTYSNSNSQSGDL